MSIGGKAKAETVGRRETETEEEKRTGVRREKLVLEQAAIEKIIADVLGGTEGLASIFAGEQTAGVFGSSVAAQAAGDLAANLVGELAKITGERVITEESEAERQRRAKSRQTTFGIETSGKFGI